MKTQLHPFFSLASPLLPLSLGIQLSKPKGIMPFYHLISDDIPPHVKHLYRHRTKKEFIADIDFFLKHYEVIDLQAILNNHFPTRKPYCFLSFDDGLKEVYEEAMPILLEKGVPATVFLNSDFVDNQALMFRYKESLQKEGIEDESHFLQQYRPYMTSEQIKDWIQKGFAIGTHSQNHPYFSQLSLSEQLAQVKNSGDFLLEKFETGNQAFAFPFTDDGVKKDFFEAIYQTDIQVSFGCAGLKQDVSPQHFQRIPMEGTAFSAQTLIKNEYFYYLLKMPFGKNKIKR